MAHLCSYRLKNPVGQCRTAPAVPAVYETTDTAAVPVASSKKIIEKRKKTSTYAERGRRTTPMSPKTSTLIRLKIRPNKARRIRHKLTVSLTNPNIRATKITFMISQSHPRTNHHGSVCPKAASLFIVFVPTPDVCRNTVGVVYSTV